MASSDSPPIQPEDQKGEEIELQLSSMAVGQTVRREENVVQDASVCESLPNEEEQPKPDGQLTEELVSCSDEEYGEEFDFDDSLAEEEEEDKPELDIPLENTGDNRAADTVSELVTPTQSLQDSVPPNSNSSSIVHTVETLSSTTHLNSATSAPNSLVHSTSTDSAAIASGSG
ncbi:hypothetical protein scyTo_0005413 [Scyliorhinus torazame]|uniref:Uncharacterized protein n=1 Tax=Scyliorhinus torazame TaxID=75743 RepID=A0A401P7H8_SCYTO|nr:hypothetical protein [Scyliorhinus torazame]